MGGVGKRGRRGGTGRGGGGVEKVGETSRRKEVRSDKDLWDRYKGDELALCRL